MTTDLFYKKYVPQYNQVLLPTLEKGTDPNDMCPWGGCMYETYGEEMAYIKEVAQKHPRRIWTILDGESDTLVISAGLHYVNRLGYIITQNEWSDPNEEYIDSPKEDEEAIDHYWSFVEEYYPDYSSSSLIARFDDLSKIILSEEEEGDDAWTILQEEFKGSRLKAAHERNDLYPLILSEAIEGYLISKGKPIKIRVFWGEDIMTEVHEKTNDELKAMTPDGYTIKDYTFNTRQEVKAFFLGMEEANGWKDYISVDLN